MSDNHNEAITAMKHLAMPQRQIPVLIESNPEKAEGFAPAQAQSGKPFVRVRRLLPEFVQDLENPRRRKEIEHEHGAIGGEEWNRLREMLALKDRMNTGDWSPVVTDDMDDLEAAFKDLLPLLDRLSPKGWLKEDDRSGKGNQTFKAVEGDFRFEVEFKTGPIRPLSERKASRRKDVPFVLSDSGRGGKTYSGTITREVRTAVRAFCEAFTEGLSKTRFVVWWSDVSKKFVPGLFCPDILTALYALAMWSSGTAGGWAICQRCGENYARRHPKQRYCSDGCRVAAAMKRYRLKTKTTAKPTKRGRK